MKKRYVTFLLMAALAVGTAAPLSAIAKEPAQTEASADRSEETGKESSQTPAESKEEVKSSTENNDQRTEKPTVGEKESENNSSDKTEEKHEADKTQGKATDTTTEKSAKKETDDSKSEEKQSAEASSEKKEGKTSEEKTEEKKEDILEDKEKHPDGSTTAASDGDVENNVPADAGKDTGSDGSLSEDNAFSDGAVTEADSDGTTEDKDDDKTQTLDLKDFVKSVLPESALKENKKVKMTSGDEWKDIPHTAIEYNTWDKYTDSLGAVYSKDGQANFDIYSEMPAHLGEGGGEFTSGITVKFNDSYDTAFYPRFITVDDKGNVNWDPQLTNLKNGKYKLYIASTDAWHTSSNIKELNAKDQIYGEAVMTIGVKQSDGETRDTMRWSLDLEKVAKRYGMSGEELKTISAQYSRLGQQWCTCAGTPTGTNGLFAILALITGAVPIGLTKMKILLV